jgi:6-pyruvoyltetrahydropterin/6-carboxytetrahydropterin synthase
VLIRKTFKAEIAHRLVDSYSEKCQSIHGHSYTFEVILHGNELDGTGMLIDFGEVKNRINHIIEAWDHSFMFWDKDPLADLYLEMLHIQPMRMIYVNYNPTAEHMALHLFQECACNGLPVISVKIHETRTGYAEANRASSFIYGAKYFNIPEVE